MSIYSIYVISEAGSLKYYYDHTPVRVELEKTYSYPLPFKLKSYHGTVVVEFGAQDGVQLGHSILAVNGMPCSGRTRLPDGTDVLEYLNDQSHYPIQLKFGPPPLNADARIKLASTFHTMYHMARELSPAGRPCTGIQCLETEGFRAHCFETLSGIKFLLVTDHRLANHDLCLQKIYEAYCDFALKNPFYTLENPINLSLFSDRVKFICENIEKNNIAAL